jgi:hypothetical protein
MTYSYREQIEILKMISVSEGERKTLDCPFCGGRRKVQHHQARWHGLVELLQGFL